MPIPQVFVSYCHDDRNACVRFANWLSENSLGEYKVDLDVNSIEPGDNWKEKIGARLLTDTSVIVLCGNKLGTVQVKEIQMAISGNSRIFPILLPGAPYPSGQLGELSAGNLDDIMTRAGLNKLCQWLKIPERPANVLDSVHLHLDGTVAEADLAHIATHLREKGYRVRERTLKGEIAGPHRQELAFQATYEVHTPAGETVRFLTVWGRETQEWKGALEELLKVLAEFQEHQRLEDGVVVEVEQLIAAASGETLKGLESEGPLLPQLPDIPYRGYQSHPFEVHMKLDALAKGGEPPCKMEVIRDEFQKEKIPMGGIFCFQRADGTWSYRTNAFLPEQPNAQLREEVKKQYSAFRAIAERLAPGGRTGMVVERALNLWRTPLRGRHTPPPKRDSLRLFQFAEWEASVEPLKEFWIIVSNFFGDRYPEIRHCMIENLRRETPVHYRYFLSTLTDVRRLLRFVQQLGEKVNWASRYVTAYILDPQQTPQPEGFIAIHDTTDYTASGYRISRNRDEFARVMGTEEVRLRVKQLRHLVEPHVVQGWAVKSDGADNKPLGIRLGLAIHVPDLAGALEENLMSIELFIDCLATAVSQHGGILVDTTGNTSIAIFARDEQNTWPPVVDRMLACLEQLSCAVARERDLSTVIPGLLRFGSDLDEAFRVLRPSGSVVHGKGISGCRHIAKNADPFCIEVNERTYREAMNNRQRALFEATAKGTYRKRLKGGL